MYAVLVTFFWKCFTVSHRTIYILFSVSWASFAYFFKFTCPIWTAFCRTIPFPLHATNTIFPVSSCTSRLNLSALLLLSLKCSKNIASTLLKSFACRNFLTFSRLKCDFKIRVLSVGSTSPASTFARRISML